GAVPGKMDPSLGHESFVFRAHRTFMNTLENIPAILGTCFLAILIGTNPFWTAVFIWVFVACRIIHMVLYYVIATDKNPSPRTYFFSLGLFANICLLGLCVKTLIAL
ncbi:MAG: MAPEG family protein, partial [Cellvibrio sp.]